MSTAIQLQARTRLQGKDEAMQQALKPRTPRVLVFFLITASAVFATGQTKASENPSVSAPPIRGNEHYVMRDGLRIYLWEKYKEGDQESFSHTGKVALLVHGGTWSGRPLFDLRIRDYSLMDFLAENGYDVWPLTSTATGVPTRLTKIGRIRIPQPPISLQR